MVLKIPSDTKNYVNKSLRFFFGNFDGLRTLKISSTDLLFDGVNFEIRNFDK